MLEFLGRLYPWVPWILIVCGVLTYFIEVVVLPNWSPNEADSLASDELSVQPKKNPFQLLRLTQKNPPFRQW